MKKRTMILTALAAVLISTAGIGSAHAYFTTYAQAQGGYTLSLGDRTEITEEVTEWTKHVVITSEEGSQPVYVRARAYAGSTYQDRLAYSGDGWSVDDDGWYYYGSILKGAQSTSELLVRLPDIPKEDLKDGDSFNVVVVYETTPVRYHEDGSPYADWNETLKTVRTEGGGN